MLPPKPNKRLPTHHELDIVEAIGKQVVLVLDQADGVQPLTHGLQRTAGAYERVEGEALEQGVAIHTVAAAVGLGQLALPHHVVACKVAIEGACHGASKRVVEEVGVRRWGQAEQGAPGPLLPSNVFQFLLGDPEAFPGQLGYVILPVYLMVSYQLDVPRKPPRGGAPFDAKEQRLYSELPPDVRAPHPISKAEPSHPMEETNFGRLYSRFRSFGHCPKLMTIDLEILELLHLGQQLTPNPKGAIHHFPAENHGLRLGGADSHPDCFTLGCKPPSVHWSLRSDEANKTTSSAKSRDAILRFPNWTLSSPRLPLEILSMNITNRIGEKGQPWWSPTLTKKDPLRDTVESLLHKTHVDWMGKVPLPPNNLERDTEEACQPRQPNNVHSLQHCLAAEELSDCLRDLCQAYGQDFPQISDSASSTEDVLVGFRSSSKCSFHHPTISPVRVSSSPPWLNTAVAKPCFPFLSHQKFLEANRKSFSIASPNSSYTQVFASVTAEAAALLGCRYLSAPSGDPWASQARKASFFSLTASFTAGVHQWVLRLPPRQAPNTFRPQLLAAASAMEVLNMTHSDSMSPTSPGMCEKFFQSRIEATLSFTGENSNTAALSRGLVSIPTPLTLGNSGKGESPAPLQEFGSRASAVCRGDTATRLESDRDLDSWRSSVLRGIDLILPRVQARSSWSPAAAASRTTTPLRPRAKAMAAEFRGEWAGRCPRQTTLVLTLGLGLWRQRRRRRRRGWGVLVGPGGVEVVGGIRGLAGWGRAVEEAGELLRDVALPAILQQEEGGGMGGRRRSSRRGWGVPLARPENSDV
ncbi:hypothetical protein N1851_017229 [Merluccius polli]|uniref:Uncharacterized protein n=1 Tax=Merluccius polli TaxID=89951 RepID=A0AA47MQH8_MERPO|nr:hypothetical protein N1851_017229 [Merluccius polli]